MAAQIINLTEARLRWRWKIRARPHHKQCRSAQVAVIPTDLAARKLLDIQYQLERAGYERKDIR